MCSQNESKRTFCIFCYFKKPIGIEDDFGMAGPVSLLMKIRPWASHGQQSRLVLFPDLRLALQARIIL